jgi:hypothetical protein
MNGKANSKKSQARRVRVLFVVLAVEWCVTLNGFAFPFAASWCIVANVRNLGR